MALNQKVSQCLAPFQGKIQKVIFCTHKQHICMICLVDFAVLRTGLTLPRPNKNTRTQQGGPWSVAHIKNIPGSQKKRLRSVIIYQKLICNLCSTLKIFERLILLRALEVLNDSNLAGETQQGFELNLQCTLLVIGVLR